MRIIIVFYIYKIVYLCQGFEPRCTLSNILYGIMYRFRNQIIECDNKWVTMRCRLSWLTNGALVYEPKCRGGGGGLSQ
jgi:hypothetical protein